MDDRATSSGWAAVFAEQPARPAEAIAALEPDRPSQAVGPTVRWCSCGSPSIATATAGADADRRSIHFERIIVQFLWNPVSVCWVWVAIIREALPKAHVQPI
jgi:hypothetical protein